MAWDFIADSENQKTLSELLDTKAGEYDDQIVVMYGKVDSLGEAWSGEDYDAFNTGAHGYKNALHDLTNGIKLYAEHFNSMSEGTETLASELISIIENMTGSENSSSGSGSGTSGSSSGSTSGSSSGRPGSSADSSNSSSSIIDDDTNTESDADESSSRTSGGHTTSDSSTETSTENGNAVDVDTGDFMLSSTYSQWQTTGGTWCYLDDDMSILYQNGVIYYPDGTYEKQNLSTLDALTSAYAKNQNYTYDSSQSQLQTSVSNSSVDVDDIDVTEFMGTTVYAQWNSSGGASCFLNDEGTVQYDDGKILYSDGTYENVTLNNLNDLMKAWATINNS